MSRFVVDVRVDGSVGRQVLVVSKVLCVFEMKVVQTRNMFNKVSAHDSSILSFSPKAAHSSLIAKLSCFKLKMTTAIGSYEGVCSWQSVNQDEVDVDGDRGRHSYLYCLCLWRPKFLALQVVLQSNLFSSETDFDILRKRMQRAMVT